MRRRLEEQTAWISGAASGIGEATARLFAEEGANVVLVDVNSERGTAARDAIHRQSSRVEFVHADVSNEDDVRRSIKETVARFGGVSILVNCAGLVHVRMLHEYEADDWDRLMGVNLKSIFFSVKHALPYLRQRPHS